MNNGERFVYQSFHVTVKRFAVEEDLSMNLVAHQLTARKNEKTMEGIETRVNKY
jgi:hypothetical protein